MSHVTESLVEEAALEWLAGLGYAVLYGPDISPDGSRPERGSYDQVLLTVRLREALARLNPHLPAELLEEVLRKVQQTEIPSLIEENRRLHRYLIEGVPVEVAREDGSIGGDVARADRPCRHGRQRLAGGQSVHGDRGPEEPPAPMWCCSSTACLWP